MLHDNKIMMVMMMMMMMIIMIKRIILLLLNIIIIIIIILAESPLHQKVPFVESCRLTKYIYNFIHKTPLLCFNIILSYTVNGNKPYTEKTKKVSLQDS